MRILTPFFDECVEFARVLYEFALVFRSGANMLRVVRVDEFTPHPFAVLGWETAAIEETVRSLSERGS